MNLLKHRHYADRIFLGLVVFDTLLPWFLHGTARSVEGYVMLGVMFAVIGVRAWHDLRLCEQCISEIPLNIEEFVERRMFFLRANHSWIPIVVMLLLGSPEFFFDHNLLLDNLIETVCCVPVLLVIYSGMVHTKLRPWCPICSGGDGGDEDAIEAPTPNPVVSV